MMTREPAPDHDCEPRAPIPIVFSRVGSTSQSRPIFIGLVALTLQFPVTVGARGSEPQNEFVGVLFSRNEEVLRAEIGGRISSVSAELGERVKKGQRIVGIDDRGLRVKLSEAAAELQTAIAEHNVASSESVVTWQRYSVRTQTSALWSKEEIARTELEFERTVATKRVAWNRIVVAQLSVRNAELQLEASQVAAPFSGWVAALYIEAGAQILAGAPIVRVIGDQRLWVRFCVPVNRVDRVRRSARVKVRLPDTIAPIDAVVRNVGADIDVPSGMVIVEAELAMPQPITHYIRSGGRARVGLGWTDQREWERPQ